MTARDSGSIAGSCPDRTGHVPQRSARCPTAQSCEQAGQQRAATRHRHAMRDEIADDALEGGRIKRGALSTDRAGRHSEQAIDAHPTRSALGVPGTAADRNPTPTASTVPTRHHHRSEPTVSGATQENDGAVLADGRIVLERHPAPYDLTRVSVTIRLRPVLDAHPADVVDSAAASRLWLRASDSGNAHAECRIRNRQAAGELRSPHWRSPATTG